MKLIYTIIFAILLHSQICFSQSARQVSAFSQLDKMVLNGKPVKQDTLCKGCVISSRYFPFQSYIPDSVQHVLLRFDALIKKPYWYDESKQLARIPFNSIVYFDFVSPEAASHYYSKHYNDLFNTDTIIKRYHTSFKPGLIIGLDKKSVYFIYLNRCADEKKAQVIIEKIIKEKLFESFIDARCGLFRPAGMKIR